MKDGETVALLSLSLPIALRDDGRLRAAAAAATVGGAGVV
jgi:hypothetical protein